ncbi:hypothetical protein GGS20DRAFT_590379 [Poronia punctata]|nr:hypothetical protein GGS20DRAFT_590379 [Poronia punctata]
MKTQGLTRGGKRKYEGQHTRRPFSKTTVDAETGLLNSTSRSGPEDKGKGMPEGPVMPSRTSPGAGLRGRDERYFNNLYATEPDFHQLGTMYPEFRSMLHGGVHLDFTDPSAIVQLTKTLLKEDFGLHINLLPDRLCPPVPNRHNYILWLKQLMDTTSPSFSDRYEPDRQVTGLDVGTGASLIYPLLGCVQRPGWHFIATDVDTESLANARLNAAINGLETRIRIVRRATSDALIPLDELGLGSLDFVMVNPPFYASESELLSLAAQKSRPPRSACTGALVEMVCEGGEVEFVKRLIDESLRLRERVQWYTAMLGKQSSIETLVEILRVLKIGNFAVTGFIQGSRTRRWALGWSFSTRRPSLAASRGHGLLALKTILPPSTEIRLVGPASDSYVDAVRSLRRLICETMAAMDLRLWAWEEERLRGIGFADGNVWSRAYRRRQRAEMMLGKQKGASSLSDVGRCAFGFSVTINTEENGNLNGLAVTLRWLQGEDQSLFESLSGVLRRSLRLGRPRSPAIVPD